MPEYADIYALAADRTEESIKRFLDHFLPSRIESADEFEVPQYSRSPRFVFIDAGELIRHCCTNGNEVHAVYWRSDSRPERAMVFFLADGGMILGVSTPAENHQQVDRISAEIERHLGAEEVIVTYEDLPPESAEAFRAFFQSLPPNPDETARRCRAHRPIKGGQDPGGNPLPRG